MSQERYIGGPTGGIPEDIFIPGFKGVINCASGEKLGGNITKDLVVIASQKDSKNEQYIFVARRSKHDHDALELGIKTKIGNPPEKHKDLYAKELAKKSIIYLEEQGTPITKIRGFWQEGDNFDAYQNYMDDIRQTRPTTGKDQRDAARNTWTGKLAESLGFTEIESIGQTKSGSILTYFKKAGERLE